MTADMRDDPKASGRSAPLVLIPEIIHPDGVALLREAGCEPVEGWLSGPAAARAALKEAEAVIVRTAPFGAEMIAAAPRLRVISKHGVGCDNIDVAAARARGIAVAVTAAANAPSVAEHAMALMLAAARNLGRLGAAARGDFARRGRDRVVDLAGRRLLIVGYGRIGRRLARLAAAFGMEVTAFDPAATAEADGEANGVRMVASLAEGLRGAEVLSVHVPLAPQTRHLIDEAALRLLAPGAIVVNCARGGVVDDAALARLAAEGHVGGVASDVFETEPPAPDDPLLAIEGAILTPHAAAMSEEAKRAMAVGAARNALDGLAGRLDEAMIFRG